MSYGNVFNVIINTSSADKLLFATDFLKYRITELIKKNDPDITLQDLISLPENDKNLTIDRSILPSMNEIEKSHSVFINSSYKPSVPLSSEYIKIPYSNPKYNTKILFQMPQIGQFTNDCMLHIRLSPMSVKNPIDRIRYVALLGHRLVKHVRFLVGNGGVVDEYGTDDYNAYLQYEVKPEHKIGYLRNIGQEIPKSGYIVGDPTMDMFQEYKTVGDGNQTLKYRHESVDLLIPILFWFKDTRNALPQLPWGKLQIEVELADDIDIIGFFDGTGEMGSGGGYNAPIIEFCDLYVNQLFTLPEVFSLYSRKFVFSIIRTHRAHKEVIKVENSKEYKIMLNNLKWPTELIFASFRPRANLALSQYWFKNCKLTEKSYKIPVMAKNSVTVINATTDISIPATINTVTIASTSSLSTVNDFYKNYDLVITGGRGYNTLNIENNNYTVSVYTASTKTIRITTSWYQNAIPDNTTTFELFTPQLAVNNVTYYQEDPVVDTISLSVHDIDIFKDTTNSFYNSYLASKYKNLNTPDDRGMYLIPFCSYPFNHNPSGSLNISIARELYIKFTSCAISNSYPVDLIVLARTINFLLVDSSSGGLHLKYSL